jgi:type VI secretion system secreted protein VgrG
VFEFDLEVVALDGIGPGRDSLVTSAITLVFAPVEPGGAPHRVHGNIAAWSEDLDSPPEFAHLSLRVVPRALALTAVESSETFVDQSILDLVKHKLVVVDVLNCSDFRLIESYAARDFVAQYQESDLALVSRLLEHVGICYAFEHHETETRIVLTDHAGGFAPVLPETFSRERTSTARPIVQAGG